MPSTLAVIARNEAIQTTGRWIASFLAMTSVNLIANLSIVNYIVGIRHCGKVTVATTIYPLPVIQITMPSHSNFRAWSFKLPCLVIQIRITVACARTAKAVCRSPLHCNNQNKAVFS
ncbi:MAG: hypothetical protein LBT42_02495, partial [Tannerella sp.]|nr:hypothetical protein [Tannerella sp.]